MAIRPAGHRVLVMPDKIDEKTDGGLFIPIELRKNMGDAQIFGVVVDMGRNAFKDFSDGEPWCKVGDRVAFAKYGGLVIREPNTNDLYRLLNDEDICAVITED